MIVLFYVIILVFLTLMQLKIYVGVNTIRWLEI